MRGFDIRNSLSSIFSVPVLCAGLCLIAIGVLVPQAEANRRLAVDRDQLRLDLAHVDAQLDVNGRFLATATTDPEVAERLAQRQMRQIRQGATALRLPGDQPAVPAVATVTDMLRVPTPAAVAAYRPPVGIIGNLTNTTHRQLCGLGGGLFLVAVGLVMGSAEPATPALEPEPDPAEEEEAAA